MTRQDTIKVLSVLKAAYPNFYKNMSKDEALSVINLWSIQLSDTPVDIVIMAVNKIIATSKWPPTISEVKDKIQGMYHESMSTLMTTECSEREKEALLRIANHCRHITSEPSLLQLTSKERGDRIEQAYDKCQGNMPTLQA